MNVVTPKNKVEQGLVAAYDAVADKLVGGEDVRKAALGRFEATGLPHRRIEEWKYTDLRNMIGNIYPAAGGDKTAADLSEADLNAALGPLSKVDAWRVVFVDGVHAAALDQLDGASGLTVATLAKTLAQDPATAENRLAASETTFRGSAVVDLNAAFASDGSVITIDDNAHIEKPVLVVHVSKSATPVTTTVRHKLNCGSGASVHIVEAFVCAPGSPDEGLVNTLTEVSVGDNATLHHIKSVHDHTAATHLANWSITIGKEANYHAFSFTAGCRLARTDGLIQFRGDGAKLDFSGAFLGRGRDHIDNTLVIEHHVPHCESRELFKGVLDDQARGIFQGKVFVAQAAQKTDGKQMAQALMLSPDAEFDSKPELEIYADDVLCGHGSTSAEIDDDLLFYLRSRGIPMEQARALLIESFVGEALEAIEHEQLRDALTEISRSWLTRV